MPKVSTTKMKREDWLKERKKGIGSSDAPAILGLNPWRTAIDVFNDKTDPQVKTDIDSERARMGLLMEPVIAKRYAEETGYTLRNDNFIRIHPIKQFMIANLDRIIYAEDLGPGICEIKNSSHMTLNKWDGNIPPYYFAQVQHQFAVTGLLWGAMVFLLDGWELKPIPIRPDPEYIQFMIEEEEKFWMDHVIKGVPPEPQTPEEIQQAYRHSIKDTVVEATPETYDVYLTLSKLDEQSKLLNDEIEKKKSDLKMILKENEALMFGGNLLATWKENIVTRFNQKDFQKDNPELFIKYQVDSIQRRFLLK